jgi:hypothetical protein
LNFTTQTRGNPTPPLSPTYKCEKGRTLSKTYGIKAGCNWEHPWGTQAFTIISNDEAKVIHMMYFQELDEFPERMEKRGTKI